MKSGIFVSMALVTILAVTASRAESGRFGVGMEGTPNGASPTLRIILDEATAVNLSAPSVDYSSYWSGKTWNLGWGAAVLPWRRSVGNIKHGPRLGAYGTFQHQNPDSGPSQKGVGAGANIGWDLEYFVAAVPGLSVGGNVSAGYGFSWTENPGVPDNFSHRAVTVGNNLNLRYYF